jgi:hypothetical protein
VASPKPHPVKIGWARKLADQRGLSTEPAAGIWTRTWILPSGEARRLGAATAAAPEMSAAASNPPIMERQGPALDRALRDLESQAFIGLLTEIRMLIFGFTVLAA